MRRLVPALAAVALLQCSVAIAQGHAVVPRTIADVTQMLADRRPDPAIFKRLADELAAPAPPEADREALVAYHQRQAQAAAGLGLVPRVLQARRHLVALTEGQRNQPKHLLDLAIAEMTAGNWSAAEEHARRAAAAPTGWWGQDILAMMVLARVQSWLGDVTSARTQTDRAEELFRRVASQALALPFTDLVGGMIAWSKGDTQLTEGRAIAGEASLVAAAKHALADTKIAERRQSNIEWAPAPDSTWQLLDLIEAQLARVHAQQGHLVDAEQVARAMLVRNLERLGRDAPSTAVSLAVLGEVLISQQRWREAAALADVAAIALEKAGAKVSSGYAFQAERVRIDSRLGAGDWKAATALIDGLRSRLADEKIMLRATERRGAWALALVRDGRAPEAASWLERLWIEHQRVYGKDRYETAESRGLLGLALAAQGKRDEAYEALAAAIPVLLAPAKGTEADAEDGLRRLNRRAIVEAWIGLLYDIQGTPLAMAKGIDAAAEAFRIADSLRGGSLQSAVAASAARALAGTPQLGDLIRREQDGKREIVAMNNQLAALALTPDSAVREKAVTELRQRIASLEGERTELFQRIEQQFPDYANLINPRPAGVGEVLRVLAPQEALISILPTESRTFVWVFAPGGIRAFHASPLAADAIALRVTRLRETLDPGDLELDRLRQFDLEVAHELYRELLAPVEHAWGGSRELVIVSGGALGQLPLSLLPTKPAGALAAAAVPFAEMKQVQWLVRRAAVSNVPSVNSLVRMRGMPAGSPARLAFAGFGDPQFGPIAGAAATTRGLRLRNLAVPRVDAQTDSVKTAVPWLNYGALAPLPDTREEVRAIAKVLGADPGRDVFVGADASRIKVRQTDLSTRKIIAFATHGLVPGDLPGLTQPALALAANANSAESPLLTLEDVLGLRLDADWVVLSACNTAAGDGQGAEAVSGLGRGFFYAGSRALLVTHWPVETVSARVLVTDVFDRYAREPGTTRSVTLQRAMLALLDGPGNLDDRGQPQYSYAHPIFWAPYALYGDGAR
jgi:CHAT domain-containing protein